MEPSSQVLPNEPVGQTPDGLRLGSVRFSEKGVAEMDQHRVVVFVPRDEVQGLEAVYTTGAERPLLTVLVGLVILGVALSPLALLVKVFLFGGTLVVSKPMAWIMALAPVGGWMIYFSVKQRLVLLVHAAKGTRKVVFQGKPDLDEVRDFLQKATRYGYRITDLTRIDAAPTK